MDKMYIIIPAYNEEVNIETVIKDWYPIVEQHNGEGSSRLVIIDDGSTDATLGIIEQYAEYMPFLVPLTKKNSGHGPTILFGYQYAIENGADYIFQTDSDGQTLPQEFEQFWDKRKSYDMVIGHRSRREDGASRIIVTKVLKWVIRICFHVSVTDANTPYRLMKVSTLRKYIKQVPDDFNLSNVLISVIYAKKNLSVKYIPITFRPRQGGVNSINVRKIVNIGKKALKDFRTINEEIK